ncbi:MAG: HNH endonuclease [Bacteroidota bacterium]|nr:HNH endonuclease [Bacteroidota bacterium]MDP4234291.1 HNH endonuclease [Bacteroidota bacterium]MDP4288068.1 HNH endonuclease [Bacteroidota bacterium]
MKLGNFARLDPALQSRGVGGLSHGGKGEVEIWEEFSERPEPLAIESEEARKKILSIEEPTIPELPEGPTDTLRSVHVRMVQAFFRRTVLSGYNFSCCFCGLGMSDMLVASHIIPWSVSVELRADPRNGIALCAFHDRAFDRGILGVDETRHIIVSSIVAIPSDNQLAQVGLLALADQPIKPADRFQADPESFAFHRNNIFKQ